MEVRRTSDWDADVKYVGGTAREIASRKTEGRRNLRFMLI
jgi:hypothetical protein